MRFSTQSLRWMRYGDFSLSSHKALLTTELYFLRSHNSLWKLSSCGPNTLTQAWLNHPTVSVDKQHTILSANKKWLPTRAKKRIQKQAVRIGTEAVLHFPSISPMCMLRGSVMWKKGRGWHIWLIHKFRTEPAFWKWLIQGDWEEMEGNEVGGPWIKGARKGDWYWRAVVHG